MSIRGIIEAATPVPWRIATSKSVKVGDSITLAEWEAAGRPNRTICRTHDRKWRYGNDEQETNDARFIATFNPEHVALMEAVCDAEDNGTDAELTAAGTALKAYRKERGL